MNNDTIQLAAGGGGEATKDLIETLILPRFSNELLKPLTDGAVLNIDAARICVTTDASVVTPLEFPGGDIGRLAVCGTVNDLSMMGATPKVLTLSMIIEEGLERAQLERILDSIKLAAEEANVMIAAGDTKVVNHHGGDGLYLSTAGVGVLETDINLGIEKIQAGDLIAITGTIADHGMALMALREGLSIKSGLESDVAPLAGLVKELLRLGDDLKFMRDPTRGGLAGVLVDIAETLDRSVDVRESDIPINGQTHHVSELLGIDPLVVANEGKLVAVINAKSADRWLKICHAHPLAKNAAIIGEVKSTQPALVELITKAGGRRIVRRAYGEELPRIC